MSARAWSRLCLIAGSLLLLLALVWWGAMYALVMSEGDSTLQWAHCLVLPASDCNLFRGMAWLRGSPPYEPGTMWVALVLLYAGATLRRAASPRPG